MLGIFLKGQCENSETGCHTSVRYFVWCNSICCTKNHHRMKTTMVTIKMRISDNSTAYRFGCSFDVVLIVVLVVVTGSSSIIKLKCPKPMKSAWCHQINAWSLTRKPCHSLNCSIQWPQQNTELCYQTDVEALQHSTVYNWHRCWNGVSGSMQEGIKETVSLG